MTSSIPEKEQDHHVDDLYDASEKSNRVPEQEIEFNEAETKRLLRKVDFLWLPVLTLLYLM
jgi:hypothetical protein